MMYTALNIILYYYYIPQPRCRFPRTHAHAARGKYFAAAVKDLYFMVAYSHGRDSTLQYRYLIYSFDGADSLHLADHHTNTCKSTVGRYNTYAAIINPQ